MQLYAKPTSDETGNRNCCSKIFSGLREVDDRDHGHDRDHDHRNHGHPIRHPYPVPTTA